VALVRAYANIADELESAGYSAADIGSIKQRLDHYLKLREIIRKASDPSGATAESGREHVRPPANMCPIHSKMEVQLIFGNVRNRTVPECY
jgi:hypothetical protein